MWDGVWSVVSGVGGQGRVQWLLQSRHLTDKMGGGGGGELFITCSGAPYVITIPQIIFRAYFLDHGFHKFATISTDIPANRVKMHKQSHYGCELCHFAVITEDACAFLASVPIVRQ